MGDNSPVSEKPCERVSVDGIPRISSHPLLLLFPLVVRLPKADAGAVKSQPLLQVEKALDATHILLLELLECKHLRLLFFHRFNELIDVSLLLVAVYLIVGLVFNDVCLLHKLILFE